MGGPLQNAAGEKAAAHRGEHTARRARRATERGLQPGAVPPRGFTSSALIRPSPWNRIASVNCLRAYADASRAPGSRTSRRRAAVPCPCAPYRRVYGCVPVPRTAVSPCPVRLCPRARTAAHPHCAASPRDRLSSTTGTRTRSAPLPHPPRRRQPPCDTRAQLPAPGRAAPHAAPHTASSHGPPGPPPPAHLQPLEVGGRRVARLPGAGPRDEPPVLVAALQQEERLPGGERQRVGLGRTEAVQGPVHGCGTAPRRRPAPSRRGTPRCVTAPTRPPHAPR